MKQKFFFSLLARAFKMMKNGVHFIAIVFMVAELFKILTYTLGTQDLKNTGLFITFWVFIQLF